MVCLNFSFLMVFSPVTLRRKSTGLYFPVCYRDLWKLQTGCFKNKSQFFLAYLTSQFSFICSKMASLQKVQEFDLENLTKFKKSLICEDCRSPPRPGQTIYHLCELCRGNQVPFFGLIFFTCEKCFCCQRCRMFEKTIDNGLTAFVSSFKLYNCLYLNNGCEKEFEAKSLEAHERICSFRDVTCPKLDCNEKLAIGRIWEHYQRSHKNMENFYYGSLKFKGTLEDLKKKTFVLNNYGRSFFLQFYVNQKRLNFWIVGRVSKISINFQFRNRY